MNAPLQASSIVLLLHFPFCLLPMFSITAFRSARAFPDQIGAHAYAPRVIIHRGPFLFSYWSFLLSPSTERKKSCATGESHDLSAGPLFALLFGVRSAAPQHGGSRP